MQHILKLHCILHLVTINCTLNKERKCSLSPSHSLTHSLTHSLMELSRSSEAVDCAATQELRSVLWNTKVNYRDQAPSTGPYSEPDHPVHTIPSYLSKIHFNIVHSPTSWSCQWSLSFWHSHQYPICIPLLPHSCYMPCPSHPS
jgi:hypothetical protein